MSLYSSSTFWFPKNNLSYEKVPYGLGNSVKQKITLFILGHITKEEAIPAGLRLLEHILDN